MLFRKELVSLGASLPNKQFELLCLSKEFSGLVGKPRCIFLNVQS